MELRVQVEELRRRLEASDRAESAMELIDVGDGATLSIGVGAVAAVDPDEVEEEPKETRHAYEVLDPSAVRVN